MFPNMNIKGAKSEVVVPREFTSVISRLRLHVWGEPRHSPREEKAIPQGKGLQM